MNHLTTQSLNNSTNHHISISTVFWKVGILIAAFAFAYFNTISSFVKTWSGRDDYSHGFLIPFISLYFVWHKRNELRNIPIEPNIIGGFILTFIGSLMLLTGYIGSVVMVQQISVLIVIPGVVLILLGTNYLKALILPLSYLIFMIPPILDLFIGNIHWPFQLFGAAMAAKILEFIKIPVFHYAQYLELPNITLEVANACSGVRYLISIIAISIPLAFFTQRKTSLRLLFIASAIIIGILINPLRIALIGAWTYYKGGDVHGPSHIFQGFFVSQVGFMLLFAFAWFLNKFPLTKNNETPRLSLRGIPSILSVSKGSKSRSNHSTELTMKSQGSVLAHDDTLCRHCEEQSDEAISINYGLFSKSGQNIKKINYAWLTTIVILLILGSFLYLYEPLLVSLKSPLNNLPLTIGDWKGKDLHTKSFSIQVQGADFELNRIYKNSSGREIELYIGYFESQKQDKELIHYKLEKLYEQAKEIEIQIVSHKNIRVNKTVVKDGIQNSLILYWYNLNGRIIANNYKAKFILASNGLLHRRTNGAIVLVSSNLNHSDEIQKVLSDEVEFIQRILPVMKSHFSEKTG